MHAHGKMLNKLMKKVEAEYVVKQYQQHMCVCVCVCTYNIKCLGVYAPSC